MFDIHRWLGEGLFVIYLIAIGVVFMMERRGRSAPSWLIGLSHGLLGIQIAIGVILLAEGHDIVWYHPVLGIAALLALGLTRALRERFGTTNGTIATLAIVALLTVAAQLAATLS